MLQATSGGPWMISSETKSENKKHLSSSSKSSNILTGLVSQHNNAALIGS